MKIPSMALSRWILLAANVWLALECVQPTEASSTCRSCTFLGPLEDNQCERDCHTHTTPCIDDIYAYPLNSGDPSSTFILEIVGGPLIQWFIDSQAYAAYNPTISPTFASCIPSYNKVTGTCNGYEKPFNAQVFFGALCSPDDLVDAPEPDLIANHGRNIQEDLPTDIERRLDTSGTIPWMFDCLYTIETAKGNLNLQGSLPSAEQCFVNLYLLAGVSNPPNEQLVYNYVNGYTTDTDSLLGKCCSDLAITGGTGAYCLAEGSVRVCQLLDPTVDYIGIICTGTGNLEYGVSFNFDGLKGCEKNKCCDAPKSVCG